MKIDFEKDMQIDEDNLDLELLRQADLESTYIKEVSEAFKDMRFCHEEVKTTRSELIAKANKHPVKCCNKEKPNAGDIEAYYRTNKKYKQVVQDYIEAEDRYNVLKDMKDTIHFTRSQALSNLVELLKQEYFAGPVMPQELSKRKKSWGKGVTKKAGNKMKRKKKK